MQDLRAAKTLFRQAQEMGLSPKWLTDYGFFSIKVKEKTGYIFYSTTFLNTQLASYLAKNKHIARVILEENGLPSIPYSVAETEKELKKFIEKQKIIIAKPTLGEHSRDIHLIKSVSDAKGLKFENYIFEKFIKGSEIRYLVLWGKVISVHKKNYKGPINNPDRVKRISLNKRFWDKKLMKIATLAAKSLYLNFAAVDFLVEKDDKAYVLEVNASPGMYLFLNPSRGPKLNLAKIILEETLRVLAKN